MKILIVNYTDIYGGAGRAAYRLHQSLLGAGIDSQMLVMDKKSDDYTVLAPESNLEKLFAFFKPRIEQVLIRHKYKNKSQALFTSANISSKNIVKKINSINPDIVHLHWINGAMLKIEDISKIKAPIVWSLHDNWAFTGGCHVMWSCQRYKNSCGSCPILSSNNTKDLSNKVFKRKQKAYQQKNMTIVGLSKWLSKTASDSPLLEDKNHINLPNPINTEVYRQFDKKLSRQLWNLPNDKKLILFGAMSATSDINKGFIHLSEAISRLKIKDVELVVFGSSKPKNSPQFDFKTHYVGILNDDVSLSTLYSAVDVTVVPSTQENLSNVIMESLSCSTPVVAFDIGGNSDMIEHHGNGYLAKPFDSSDLANGIEWILNNENYNDLCKNAREKVLKEFDSKVVVQNYIQLYKDIIENGK
ncbi:glycosyltransferase family 4 protein [Francisella philomiragia]|uniref:glycosyltransferase family 4 protein n=1 Tax=Francisella philomiragia TaxID=28110 RepID=UPI001904C813|nr:glycosyltransferase family 4 protein [Francisella philomiragia]MBK2267561.1 glycosyltransferase family 4 protein [Francisella philomiragia]MBK2279017.1 glycosyltransferase family 4 protein [Francisella philomiragia]MBK2286743.1 glycosyltransferase family 4 protein [Francisella philomiragia]MBK2288849.1 glycosyltransferase family 4 protein [Francisella philomiragia]MBK2290567.1 glycosyltransferase family 4 protein [Francisella philomiragia]